MDQQARLLPRLLKVHFVTAYEGEQYLIPNYCHPITEAVKSKYIKFTDAEMQEETTDIMKNKPEKYREYLKKMKKNSEKENRKVHVSSHTSI